VTRAAPIQSTRLSSSVEGSSLSKAKKPNTKHAKVKPDNKYRGLFHVGLATQPNRNNNQNRVYAKQTFHSHLVNCVRTLLRTVLKNDPMGAPAEKVANAMEREGPGGNALDRMPS
jgi:hypothetical protein